MAGTDTAEIRKIIHVDMDAFYASVEQRENPALDGRPVIVGGAPDKRGVVAACSYEARRFGIHSAMASSRAVRLCPQAVFLRPRFELYRQVSAEIRSIFLDYTDLVEPLSLDEAFLDVTRNRIGEPSATRIAREIRRRIREQTRLTASAGVSYNKFLAKIASDYRKPDGLTVVTPEAADAFIERLPVGRFYGVGRVTEARMHELGIRTGADLKRLSLAELVRHFGRTGEIYYNFARGRDDRPVNPNQERKSLGAETTLIEDVVDPVHIRQVLEELAYDVETSLKKRGLRGRTVTLKVKYHDFESVTRRLTVNTPLDEAAVMMTLVERLLERTEAGRRPVRLLGITVSSFGRPEDPAPRYRQLLLPFMLEDPA